MWSHVAGDHRTGCTGVGAQRQRFTAGRSTESENVGAGLDGQQIRNQSRSLVLDEEEAFLERMQLQWMSVDDVQAVTRARGGFRRHTGRGELVRQSLAGDERAVYSEAE